MKILSIYSGHNATVGVFENGECKMIYQEEKFSNIKNHFGWPTMCLDYINEFYPIKDFDSVAITSEYQMFVGNPEGKDNTLESASRSNIRKFHDYLEYRTGLKVFFTNLRNYILTKLVSPKAKAALQDFMQEKYGIPSDKIVYVDHHFSHCLTPFYFYGLNQKEKDYILLSIDGAGDNSFSKVYKYSFENKTFDLLVNNSFDSSLGLLYAEVTRYLGMKANEHEYKVMGLAAYVSNEKYYKHIYDKLAEIIWIDEETLTFKSKFNLNNARLFLIDNFKMERFDNVAAAIQKLTEDLVIKYINLVSSKTGIKNFALSGGVFMNVKMNQKIAQECALDEVYFQPSCGDESTVIGNAAKVMIDNKVELKPIKTMYLGHSYTNQQIDQYLKSNDFFAKYDIEYVDDIELKTAELLADHKIVARFSGKCEWGARSLCNRGILGNADDLKTFFEVNDMIKMRDFWMPFAPTILEDWCEKYVVDRNLLKDKIYDSTKYMIVTFDSTDLARQHLRASIHQKDKTLRPQVCSQQDNPLLYKLLKYYEQKTGMGGIMNTSLNIHGYPLVGTLEQAFFTFDNSGLKYMTLENYLVSKKGNE